MSVVGVVFLTIYLSFHKNLLYKIVDRSKRKDFMQRKKITFTYPYELILNFLAVSIISILLFFIYLDVIMGGSKFTHPIENKIFKKLRVSNYKAQYIISANYAKLLENIKKTKILDTKDKKINVLVLWDGTNKLFIQDDKNNTIGIPQNQILQSIAKMTPIKNKKKDSNKSKQTNTQNKSTLKK